LHKVDLRQVRSSIGYNKGRVHLTDHLAPKSPWRCDSTMCLSGMGKSRLVRDALIPFPVRSLRFGLTPREKPRGPFIRRALR